jgi:hypothetical protein
VTTASSPLPSPPTKLVLPTEEREELATSGIAQPARLCAFFAKSATEAKLPSAGKTSSKGIK